MSNFSNAVQRIIHLDYQIPQSKIIAHRVLIAANILLAVILVVELLIDLEATTVQLVVASFVPNFLLLVLSFKRTWIKYIETAHTFVLFAILELHFLAYPEKFHVLVYWMPFIPMQALITKGLRNSQGWLIVMLVSIIINGMYGMREVGNTYMFTSSYLQFASAGFIFSLCVYAGFYLLYYLLGDAYVKVKGKNEEIERLNEELNTINNTLESRVFQRTRVINERNERLEKIAYMNSHQVRSHVSKIVGAAEVIQLDHQKKDDMLKIIVDSSLELDKAVKALGRELDSSADLKPSTEAHSLN